MRNEIWAFFRCSVVLTVFFLVLINNEIFAELSTNYNLRYQRIKNTIDGQSSAITDIKTGIINLSYTDRITPFIKYNISLNSSLSVQEYKPGTGESFKEKRRYINPIFEISYRLPVYSLRVGYNLNKRWNERYDKTRDEEHHYFHVDIGITPNELPDLYFRYIYNLYKTDDDGLKRETEAQEYQASSNFEYMFKSYLKAEYNASYSHTIDIFPENSFSTGIDRTEKDNINFTYKINFFKDYLDRKMRVYANYKGNYSWSKTTIFATGNGEIVSRLTPFQGLFALGDAADPDRDVLSSESRLIDGAKGNGIPTINLSVNRYLNIGIQVNSFESVSKILLYVNKDVRADSVLLDKNNWKAYYSNANIIGTTWTEIPIQNIEVIVYDLINNIYVYEITFDTSYSASYFKVVNFDLSSVPDVYVTEIEAYTSEIIQGDSDTKTYRSFIQEISTGVSYKILHNLNFRVDVSIRQTDSSNSSTLNSLGDVWTNIFSRKLPEKTSDILRDVSKTYTANANWTPYNALNVIVKAQRIENYDSKEIKDYKTNSYSAVIGYQILPGLRSNLSYNYYQNYIFNENSSNSYTAVLGLNMLIYPKVNMISDIGFTKVDDLRNRKITETTFLRNSLSMNFTKKIRTYFIYNFNKTKSTDESGIDIHTFRSTISYSVGKYMHINGNFNFTKNQENNPWSTGIGINWRILPKVQVNVYYQYSETDDTSVHSFSSTGTWNISRALRFRTNYIYTVTERTTKNEAHSISFYLTGNL